MTTVAHEHKFSATAKQRGYGESIREISDAGNIPDCLHPGRREDCRYDLQLALETYFVSSLGLAWSVDHLELIKRAQSTILDGGNEVCAFPRASGKTTILQRAIIWAAIYGHRRFPMLINADEVKGKQSLRTIKMELLNPLLYEDFPEVTHAIRHLENIPHRAGGQICRGEPTGLVWTDKQIVFPTIAESREAGNAGVAIGVAGLSGATIRGSVVTTLDREQIRPDCILIDDPQTRASAKSLSQVQMRHDIINGDILGMSGPSDRMACFVACTVIYRGDLADRLLDRELSPDWRAMRVSTIKKWPTNMELWEQYDEVRRRELLDEMDQGSARRFYQDNREALDVGAEVYWEARVTPGCASALQSAMDEYFRDPKSFLSERQNAPEENVADSLEKLSPTALARRTSNYAKAVVPDQASVVTAYIDVQQHVLYWLVCAWNEHFAGWVLDYGTYPDQRRQYFKLLDCRRTMQKVSPGNDIDGARRAGIETLVGDLQNREFKKPDGTVLRIERGYVDSKYKPDDEETALYAIGQTPFMPSMGVGIGAKDAPLSSWTKKRAVRLGDHWLIQKPERRIFPTVFIDTNFWKSEMHGRLSVPIQHTSAVIFHKAAGSRPQMLADHICAETASRVESRNRTVDEWEQPSNKPDNHLWDCLVGAQVAASQTGIRRPGAPIPRKEEATGPRKKRPRIRPLKC